MQITVDILSNKQYSSHRDRRELPANLYLVQRHATFLK